jgi:hypothetical protein
MTSNVDSGGFISFFANLGPLRLGLFCAALVLSVAVPAPGARAVYEGWGLLTSVLLPVLAPLMFMGLLLDALMTRIFAGDAEGAARSRLRAISWINLAIAVVLLLRWLPYYAALRV